MKISEQATAKIGHNGGPIICPACGEDVANPDQRRSVPHLRRYMKLIRETFKHWPEKHDRQFTNVKELRAFLQMKAGHRELVADLPIVGLNKERAVILVEAAIRASGSYALPVLHGDSMAIFRPKSIAFAKLGHMEAVGIFSEVEDVIRRETGLDPDQIMREAEAGCDKSSNIQNERPKAC